MLSHRKDRPFDLNRDFSEIKAEGRLIQILLEKMLRNKSLKIDETLNYEFIEHCQSDEKKKKKIPGSHILCFFIGRKNYEDQKSERRSMKSKRKSRSTIMSPFIAKGSSTLKLSKAYGFS